MKIECSRSANCISSQSIFVNQCSVSNYQIILDDEGDGVPDAQS